MYTTYYVLLYSIKSYLAAGHRRLNIRHICIFRLLFLIQLFSTTISTIYRSAYATYKKIQGENQ